MRRLNQALAVLVYRMRCDFEYLRAAAANIKHRPTVQKNRPPFYFMKRIPI